MTPELVRTEASKSFVMLIEPLGLVLVVMPWNFPFLAGFFVVHGANIDGGGNGVVLKHASNVCGCALAIEKVF